MKVLFDSQKVRDFIELRINYDQTGFEKIVKKFDDISGDSLLEDIIFYQVKDYYIFEEGIEHFLDSNNIEEYKNYLMVLRGVLINSVRLEEEKLGNQIFNIFMDINAIYNYLAEGKLKKMEDVLIPSKKIILKLQTLRHSKTNLN